MAQSHPIAFTHDMANRMEYVTDRLGYVTRHEYDERGNVVRTMDALSNVTVRTYDEYDNKLTETDPLGQTTTWEYDQWDNEIAETDGAGNTTRTIYNQFRQPTSITDPNGHVMAFAYDARGNLSALLDAASNTLSFVYDAQGDLVQETDALGNTTTNQYDAWGRLVERTTAGGIRETFTWDRAGNQLTRTLARTTPAGVELAVTSNTYDRENRVIAVRLPDGSANATVYDANGREVEKLDPLGRRTLTEYNARGEVVRVVYPDGGEVGYGYDPEGRKVAETNQAGFATRYEYDALGRLVYTVHPDGAVEENVYDPVGRVIESVDALGHATTYGYETNCACAGRRTSIVNALGQTTRFAYDANGNMTRFTDANGRATEYVFDAMNRMAAVVYPDGTSRQMAYDELGRRVSETDEAGNSTHYAYDSESRLVAVSNALGGVTRYAYDEAGNQTLQMDANGHATRYEYDSRGNRTKRILPEGQVETALYDAAGNLTNRMDFNGRATAFAYDAMNRLTQKTPDPAFNAPAVEYAYDARGLRTAMSDAHGNTAYQYDERGRLLEKAGPVGTLYYAYDAQGNLTNLWTSHTNGARTAYAYDELNRLRQAVSPQTGLTQYNYDEVGNLRGTIYPNGVNVWHDYDPRNRLTNMVWRQLTMPLESYAYTLAPTGHRLAVQEGNGRRVSYQYDNLHRLTRETLLSGTLAGAIDYTHDAVGNRLSRNSTLAPILAKLYGYNQNDWLDSDGYDANGNTIAADSKQFAYDYENRILAATSAASAVTIQYDGDGNRVGKIVTDALGTHTTQYLVDDRNPAGYAQVLEELSNGEVTRAYTYGLDLIAQSGTTNFSLLTSYFCTDGHGNTRFLTDAAGIITDTFTYDAFGQLIERTGTTPNNYLYCGEQFDPDLGLYFLRARYMDPDRGRFWTMDTYEGTRHDPASLHKYLYCGSEPVNAVDFSGYSMLTDIGVNLIIRNILFGIVSSGFSTWLINGEESSVHDYAVSAALGGLGGAIATVPIVGPHLGVFSTTLVGTFISACSKGCTTSEAATLAYSAALLVWGVTSWPLAGSQILDYHLMDSSGLASGFGAIASGAIAGSADELADKFIYRYCEAQKRIREGSSK